MAVHIGANYRYTIISTTEASLQNGELTIVLFYEQYGHTYLMLLGHRPVQIRVGWSEKKKKRKQLTPHFTMVESQAVVTVPDRGVSSGGAQGARAPP